MALIKDKDRQEITRLLAGLANDVHLIMFTQGLECEWCETTRNLVTEIAEFSPMLDLKVFNFVHDEAAAKEYGIVRIPAIAILGEKDYGIRFYGIPAGYEFSALMEAILAVGRRDPGLHSEVLGELAKVDKPVHIQVMVTPT